MNNQTKNNIIELHLAGELSQSEIARQFSIVQSTVSKIIASYKKGKYTYEPPTKNDNIISQEISTNDLKYDEVEETLTTTNMAVSDSLPISDTVNKTEVEPNETLNKAKITLSNYGLWLNQFALELLNKPTYLSYSLDKDQYILYIKPYTDLFTDPFYICKTKCSKNYIKTANKDLINAIYKILETKFKNNIDIDLNKGKYKIHFNFKFENGQFIINIPTMISNIDYKIL